MIARRGGARAPGSSLLHRDVLDRVLDRRPDDRRAGGRAVVAVPRRPGARARRVGRRLVPGGPGRAPADDQRPYNSFVLAGPDGTVHRYRKIHPFTYGGEDEALPRRRRARHGRRRGPAGQPVRLLRPALRRRVLAARPRHRRLPRARQLAGQAARCTGRRCCRRGRSRTRPTSSASTASATAAGSTTSATAASSTRSASCSRPPPHTETILLADISAAHVADAPRPLPLPPGPSLTSPASVALRAPVGRTMAEHLIEARGLVKRFGDFTAVDGIDVEVHRGEAFGFLGPNGAGKSSTMRMIGCTSPATGGTLRVFGLDPATHGQRIRARLGVVPQADQLDTELHGGREPGHLRPLLRHPACRVQAAGRRAARVRPADRAGRRARSSRCRAA